MGMDFRGVEGLLRHQRHGDTGGAAALATNSIGSELFFTRCARSITARIVWKCGEAYFPAAIGLVDALVGCRLVPGTFDDIVGADAAGD
jgi:hypothetical protein